MTRTQVIDALLIAGIALPSLSIFLWAAFDLRWWVEDTGDGARAFVVMMLHVGIPVGCALAVLGRRQK